MAENRTKDEVYSFDEATGTVAAKDVSVINEVVTEDLREVFAGQGEIDVNPSTPLGRFIEWFSLAFANVLRINVQNSNQFLLSAAAGQQLDALALMRGLERKIEDDGTEETDEDLRERVYAAKEIGSGFLSALKIAIDQVEGVRSAMVVENNTSAELTAYGIDALAPHSIFVCADYLTEVAEGATDEDRAEAATKNAAIATEIAQAIFKNRPCGTGYTKLGENTVGSHLVAQAVTDAFENSYMVYFHTPEDKVVNLNLKVNNRAYSGADIESDVENAVRVWFAERKFKVGETVYATEIEDGVEALVPGVIVLASIVNDAGTDPNTFQNATMLEVPACSKATVGTVNVQVIARG